MSRSRERCAGMFPTVLVMSLIVAATACTGGDASGAGPPPAPTPVGATEPLVIEAFGAIGDGIADDTVAFKQAALTGGLITLSPQKRYRLTSPVRFELPTILGGDGSAALLLEGDGGLVIHADNTTITGARIDASKTALGSCAVTLDNNVPVWLQNITLSNLNITGAPCFVRDSMLPVDLGQERSIVGLYVDDVTSTAARGQQVNLKSGFAFIFLRKLTFEAAVPLAESLIRIERNQGAGFTNLTLRGAGGAGDGILVDVCSAVFVSDANLSGFGGSGIRTQRTYTQYGPNSGFVLRNLNLSGNGRYGLEAPGTLRLLATDMTLNANVLGGRNLSNVIDGLVHETPTASWFAAPPAAFGDQPKLIVPTAPGFVSVRSFGAKGDGVTDDTQAFLSALQSGKDVYVPATMASYRLSSPISLVRPVKFIGANARLVTSASHGFDIASSDVTVQGLSVEMTPSPFAVAFFLDAALAERSRIRIVDVHTRSAGYAVTNLSAAAHPTSDLVIAKLRVDDMRNVSVNLQNIERASLDRVFGNLPTVTPNFPFLWLKDARNTIVSEGTQLGKHEPAVNSATSVVLENSSDVHLRRFLVDGTNSHGVAVLNSNRVYLSENSFVTPTTAILIHASSQVYALNTVITGIQPLAEAIRISNSNTVGFVNLLDANGTLAVTQDNNQNVLFQNYMPPRP